MERIVGGVIVIAVILISMMLHELAHGGVAYLLGDTTAKDDGRLTLNPLRHLDPFMSVILPLLLYISGGVVFGGAKPVPVNSLRLKGKEWGMALVALAGPMTILVLSFLAYLVGAPTGLLGEGSIAGLFLTDMVVVNLGFMVFNLLPIPPLDGSRVLYAFMPDMVREWMEKMEKVGLVIVYVLILVGGGVFSAVMTGAVSGILDVFYWIVGA